MNPPHKKSRVQRSSASLLPDYPLAMAIAKNGLLLPVVSQTSSPETSPLFFQRHSGSDQLSATSSNNSASSTASTTHHRRSKRYSCMKKFRSLLDHLGPRKHTKNCYQSIRSTNANSLEYEESISTEDDHHDDHHIKCNCHEFFAELEEALSQSRIFARRRVMAGDFLNGNISFGSGTGDSQFQYETTPPQNLNYHNNNKNATPRYGIQEDSYVYNRWQRRSSNSSVSFHFGDNRSDSSTVSQQQKYIDSLEFLDHCSDRYYGEAHYLDSPTKVISVTSML